MDKYEHFRQFISSFIDGPNAQAIIETLADDQERLQNLTIAVTNQLTISTAEGVYLDKRLADKGISRPPELGMSDLAFRKMGIQITAQKQLTGLIHTILETFYGEETVRANITNTQPGPYNLEDGMELWFELEDGETRVVSFAATDFRNINAATPGEVADVITRFVRTQNLTAFANTITNLDTGNEYVRIFGGAKGPYSTVSVTGGEANTRLQFPNVRGTDLAVNDTAWEVTRTVGSTLRFRWVGNSKPALNAIFPGDSVMIYGNNFSAFELDGTFLVSNVRPPLIGPDLDAGWFEIENEAFSGLRSTFPGTSPPANIPPDIYYSYTVLQSSWFDLMFIKPVKALPNRQARYALAWEPRGDLLRIYMPATTGIVARGIKGATHLHLLKKAGDLNGSFGSVSDEALAVEVVSDRIIRYPQQGFDNYASGGLFSWGISNIEIDYVRREQYVTTIFCKTAHGLPVTLDSYGRSISLTVCSVAVAIMATDDIVNTFPGAYILDPTAPYTVRSEYVVSRQKVFAGSTLTTLEVDGILPNEPGSLLFDLNKDSQEGPIRYVGVQAQNAPNVVNLVTISQSGLSITCTTDAPHGAVPGSQVVISGTTYFNGVFVVGSVPNPTTLVAIALAPQVASQVGVGTLSVLVENLRSTILLDPSNRYAHDHLIGADLTLMSDRNAYLPSKDGSDYGTYITGVAEGRVFAEKVINDITALGINIEIIIVYPSDIGLANQGGSSDVLISGHSDKTFVWGI